MIPYEIHSAKNYMKSAKRNRFADLHLESISSSIESSEDSPINFDSKISSKNVPLRPIVELFENQKAKKSIPKSSQNASS